MAPAITAARIYSTEHLPLTNKCQVQTESQRRLLNHFLSMQSSLEKSRSVLPQLSSQISSKEETPACSALWRPWENYVDNYH
ncbi:hypothetical protein P4O66_022419 [Electrophorus voltai]|uniref:Uncharacterized protein n=1 Tax=Electrophorus voltai TaxID=2609070 RepID=A0AAD8ZN02_9TELE|nr:hypothetical protein P4O66_022419 [Electrophorus voltai]